MKPEVKTKISKIFKVLGYTWGFCIFVFVSIGHIAYILTADSFLQGWRDVNAEMSPFNISYYLSVFILCSPAIPFIWISEKLEKSNSESPPSTT